MKKLLRAKKNIVKTFLLMSIFVFHFSGIAYANINAITTWAKTYGNSGYDSAYPIRQTLDGGYIVAGVNGLVLKLDVNGNIEWQKTYGGSGYDLIWSIQQSIDGGYIAAGYTQALGAVYGDAWVLKFDTNGNISGCPAGLIKDSNATVTNTNATISNLPVSGQNTNISPQISSAVVTDTSMTQSVICAVSNQPPVANAGPDQILSCLGSNGAITTLDGSQSLDPDGDVLSYAWTGPFGTALGVNPSVQIPMGTNPVTLKVDDGKGGTAEDTVNITVADKTPPSTSVAITGTSGNNGWYKSDVNVSLTSADNCSGVKEIHYILDGTETIISGSTAGFTISGDGIHNVSFWAVDNANNLETAHPATISIDKTPPVIAITGVSNGATYALGLAPTASYTVTDALSGVATSNASLTGGDSLGLGIFTYTVTALDNAGNTTTTSVAYNVIATTDGLATLIQQILTSGQIDNPGIANSLLSKIENVSKAPNDNTSDNIMQAFINQVSAQSGQHISPGAAAILINAANYIITH
ncbi:MAG: hypothetical protein FD156_1663 [Nitrospirae bacterium]|nr:MAG: hypothetical protein FD156_1663 [Nitrospirota bacterium]